MWYFGWDEKIKHSYSATMRILEKLKELNINSEEKIKIWIWLHIGNVFAWWLWHENRMDYTIIGDNVNITSRLESLTKEIKVNVAVSKDYFDRIDFENQFQFSWTYSLKWKDHEVEVYVM